MMDTAAWQAQEAGARHAAAKTPESDRSITNGFNQRGKEDRDERDSKRFLDR